MCLYVGSDLGYDGDACVGNGKCDEDWMMATMVRMLMMMMIMMMRSVVALAMVLVMVKFDSVGNGVDVEGDNLNIEWW